MDKKKESVIQEIQSHRDDLLRMADFICDNPEIGLREHQASALLTEHLRKNGFSVELGIAGLDTAFRCVYENGSGGRSIGLLCEYDALEGIGHGCGHHIQGPSILGAAVALKKCIPEDIPYKLVVYGTPAEETVGGKITMVEQGYFRDIDVAFMMHASGSGTSVDRRMMAMTGMEVAYTGKSAHAAICPEEGRSALDALILAFHGIECLNRHVECRYWLVAYNEFWVDGQCTRHPYALPASAIQFVGVSIGKPAIQPHRRHKFVYTLVCFASAAKHFTYDERLCNRLSYRHSRI